MENHSSKEKTDRERPAKGVVTARKCECCGHHEIGITRKDGRYIPLKPGMVVSVTGEKIDR